MVDTMQEICAVKNVTIIIRSASKTSKFGNNHHSIRTKCQESVVFMLSFQNNSLLNLMSFEQCEKTEKYWKESQ